MDQLEKTFDKLEPRLTIGSTMGENIPRQRKLFYKSCLLKPNNKNIQL